MTVRNRSEAHAWPARRGRSADSGRASARPGSEKSHPDGELGLLRAYRALASAWRVPDHLILAQFRPPGRVDGQAELVVGPARQGSSPQSSSRNSRARVRSTAWIVAARLLDEEFFQVVAAELELVPFAAANFLRSLSLRFRPYRVLAQLTGL